MNSWIGENVGRVKGDLVRNWKGLKVLKKSSIKMMILMKTEVLMMVTMNHQRKVTSMTTIAELIEMRMNNNGNIQSFKVVSVMRMIEMDHLRKRTGKRNVVVVRKM